MSELSIDGEPIYDIVGVGFGPSNLALAIAVTESAASTGLTAVFLERQAGFGWHRGMLLNDATMQVSFMKDLVTLRNPASHYSFISYLHSRNRLIDFINHKNHYPLRVEFHDYLEWAAQKVEQMVRYGHEVLEVMPVIEGGRAAYFNVIAQGRGPARVIRARNVVLATGLRPALPDGVTASPTVWHSNDLLRRVEEQVAPPQRIVVVGAGQSAAEATTFLHERFPDAEVCAVFSRYGYSPADDSPFANRIFDPAAVDDFYHAPPETKELLQRYHSGTNYSVVDLDLINEIYRRAYQEKVLGRERLRILNASRLVSAEPTATGVEVAVTSLITGEPTVLDADILVCATGYRPADPARVLGDVVAHCRHDEHGRLLVGRDYRVHTGPELTCGVYLQGGTEHTHGITSSLLSATAVRAGEILQSVQSHRTPAPRPQLTHA
ncbi:L-ornithine N5-oxygenase [Allocatelliglobosispora scoriae]|uniref:L-lysine N6-monooxygenase MbtG n=1 Tax=Allocatelliglobosispora scoriae TaxID=643052 RepID=A0A841BKZ9_9ACTN|nr:lysine N(6)-hydroxylase/L-ornithine N(5)-oxygenase family protein [Allocatelliglobosispora scoriae]MBB5868964.1 L-ornithine N5-oxygenase [Allocatelliglobosispora scoriae]